MLIHLLTGVIDISESKLKNYMCVKDNAKSKYAEKPIWLKALSPELPDSHLN